MASPASPSPAGPHLLLYSPLSDEISLLCCIARQPFPSRSFDDPLSLQTKEMDHRDGGGRRRITPGELQLVDRRVATGHTGSCNRRTEELQRVGEEEGMGRSGKGRASAATVDGDGTSRAHPMQRRGRGAAKSPSFSSQIHVLREKDDEEQAPSNDYGSQSDG
ncbi:hypothetical protein TRIUR3_17964 [Triticum urartu]|uniref:Uncharacterized protein n=1 Tax=Triticum urartu TaxID=4572 RepID=M8A486_TRIUA|nr:hypothetical protein TRIUR3_17964 [Triticum urartu]